MADEFCCLVLGALWKRWHNDSLLKLLQRARERNLKLNREKLRLHLLEVLLYIGHIISVQWHQTKSSKSDCNAGDA